MSAAPEDEATAVTAGHLTRVEGTLTSWNDEPGFGFIAPGQGGHVVVVHIKAFPFSAVRPEVGEPLTFEVELSAEEGSNLRASTESAWRTGEAGAVDTVRRPRCYGYCAYYTYFGGYSIRDSPERGRRQ